MLAVLCMFGIAHEIFFVQDVGVVANLLFSKLIAVLLFSEPVAVLLFSKLIVDVGGITFRVDAGRHIRLVGSLCTTAMKEIDRVVHKEADRLTLWCLSTQYHHRVGLGVGLHLPNNGPGSGMGSPHELFRVLVHSRPPHWWHSGRGSRQNPSSAPLRP